MADGTSGVVSDGPTIEELKEKYFQQKVQHYPIVARLEEPADRVFVTTFTSEEGKSLGKVRFRKWKHGEVGYLLKLPFYHKLVGNQELTEDEKVKLEALKAELVKIAMMDKGRWADFENDKRFIDLMFWQIQTVTLLDGNSAKAMEEFVNDDLGFDYGYIWINLLHKTPSEVAVLPEGDVSFVNLWAKKWFERLQEARK